ncbi:nucleobase:cation symporter-2 family protein [Nocardia sp. CDC153]|uniref:nucleobase:cation symporter-2 family protein n=1 Tax=Nocardia sp. CDC153 TaxID=3112167 RepID=UPI002DBA0774|nr:nucleobase:cation symporter-2 family protein [Nocardia sp. CDC153]MEC3956927.1 nucleobase:cation symporter-2 family protein [Nocardia sp. CDC153]
MHLRFSRPSRHPDLGDATPPPPHPVDEVPKPPRLALLGLQHLAIMYAGAVAVPLLVGGALKLSGHTIGLLVNADLLVSGIVTIIQAVGIGRILGVRLPVVAGATFTVVSPMILIAQDFGGGEAGLPTVYGAILVSGVFGLIIARFFAKVVRFFPPLVSGCVICVIGLSLIGADAGLIAGDDPKSADYGQISHIGLAGLVILLIVVIHRFARGLISQLAVLISMAIGTLVAVPMHLVDMSNVGPAAWFGISKPFIFGAPEFHIGAIISMCVVMLVTFTESTADMVAVAEMVDKELEPADLARGLAADGLSAVLAGFMNSFPDTAFAENVGLVGLTGVRSRWVVAACGGMLVALGLVPKVGSVVAALPGPVVGGAATVMFAMVTAVGLRVLHKVQFEGTNNMLIIAVTLSVALLPAVAPNIYTKFPTDFQMIASSPITSAVIVVFVLNLLFNHWNVGKRPEVTAGTH